MLVKPNLFFDGNAAEAIRFYQTVFAAEAQNVVRYGDYPKQPGAQQIPGEYASRIANARLSVGSTFFNIADVLPPNKVNIGNHVRMDIVFTNGDTSIEQVFAALSQGGVVTKPLGKVFFSTAYGELTDRFGIQWALMCM